MEWVEWADVLVGAGIALLAMRYGERRAERKALNTKISGPTCGCKHSIAFHEDGSGHCRHERQGFEGVIRCTCQKYIGPEPLPEFFA